MADDRRVREFYDELAATYDLIYPDWAASVARQGAALQRVIHAELGRPAAAVLDCACGIGTQLLGLAGRSERIIGTDLSAAAVARAQSEVARQGWNALVAVADMRALPFAPAAFDAVVCADNSLPHLTTAPDLARGLAEMARVLRPGGVLVISIRDYDAARRDRPRATRPSARDTAAGPVVTFQLWRWHDDGERYDLEHVQLRPSGGGPGAVRRRTTTYWALTRDQVDAALAAAGFVERRWHEPAQTGFFQPIVTALRRTP